MFTLEGARDHIDVGPQIVIPQRSIHPIAGIQACQCGCQIVNGFDFMPDIVTRQHNQIGGKLVSYLNRLIDEFEGGYRIQVKITDLDNPESFQRRR